MGWSQEPGEPSIQEKWGSSLPFSFLRTFAHGGTQQNRQGTTTCVADILPAKLAPAWELVIGTSLRLIERGLTLSWIALM